MDDPAVASMNEAQRLLAKAMTEKELQQDVTDLAKALNWLVYHTWNSKHSASGYPDLVMLRGARGIAVELKREGKDVTPAQEKWLEAYALAGFWADVWRPRDWVTGYIEGFLR